MKSVSNGFRCIPVPSIRACVYFLALTMVHFFVSTDTVQAQVATCTHIDKGSIGNDPTCAPAGVNEGKFNQGFADDEVRIIYIKVCGQDNPPCCGTIDIYAKEGSNCIGDEIAGPSGPNLSFDEIGEVTGCTINSGDLNTCASGIIEATGNCTRFTFLGWIADSDEPNCSYWYYKAEANYFDGRGCGLSHVTYDLVDLGGSCCDLDFTCAANQTVDCDNIPNDLFSSGGGMILDMCGTVTVTDDFSHPGACGGTVSVTYTITDDQGTPEN